MTYVVGASAHGSPGVSTALQLLAAQWPQPQQVPVLVEADVTGGVCAARFELSLSPGIVTLAESLRRFESPPLLDHAQRLPSGVACVPLSPSATAASAQLRSAGGMFGTYLRESGHPVLVDAGSLLPDSRISQAVVNAEAMLWFVRPTREELLILRHRLAECAQPDQVGIVLVGETPYNAAQVEEALGVAVMHVLPLDPRGAAAANLGGDDRFLRRSPLVRSCARLAEVIRDRIWHSMLQPERDDPMGGTLADLAPADLALADLAPDDDGPEPSTEDPAPDADDPVDDVAVDDDTSTDAQSGFVVWTGDEA